MSLMSSSSVASLLLMMVAIEAATLVGNSAGSTKSTNIGVSGLLGKNGINLKRSAGLPDQRYEFPSKTKSIRAKRTTEHLITDCIHMTSEEGQFFHKAAVADGKACGVYIFSDPDENIEIQFNYLNVPCENGGLVVVVDGWELNGEVFPSPHDHQKPFTSRFSEFCGQKKIKQTFTSSQNVALIQYRMPERGSSFSFNVRFVRNPNPCNVLFQTDEIYTLRNYGKRSNCSVSTLFPAAVKIAALDVGVSPTGGRGVELETGTIHKCQKRGLDDFVQIGGSTGLDNNNLEVADTICGMESKAGKRSNLIGCDITTVRMISSGAFDNSVTIFLRQLAEEDFSGFLNAVCLPEVLEE